jgi:hypothetical protein
MGRFSGNYNDHTVQGFKYLSPTGEVGWQTTSWPNLRDIIHNFWVSGTTLYRFGVHPAQSVLSGQPIEIEGEAANVDPMERRAIFKAIEDWESPSPVGTDWREYDPSNASTHPKDGSKIDMEFPSGRVVQANYSGCLLGSVGYANLISEEESKSKFRWRYSAEL